MKHWPVSIQRYVGDGEATTYEFGGMPDRRVAKVVFFPCIDSSRALPSCQQNVKRASQRTVGRPSIDIVLASYCWDGLLKKIASIYDVDRIRENIVPIISYNEMVQERSNLTSHQTFAEVLLSAMSAMSKQ